MNRTIIEVSGHTSFKPFPKSAAGRRTVPLPPWLVEIIKEHRKAYPLGENGLIFPNAVGKPLRRALFRSRVWRPALVRAGMLGAVTVVDGNTVRADWVDATGATLTMELLTEREAVLHVAYSCAGGLRFHDLRHSLICHVACRRWRTAEHGRSRHGPREDHNDAPALHPPHR